MKTKSDYGDVLKHGVAVEGGFNIKTTATAFKILSEGLYSNKILAFIRELGCNAYDAHVAANNQSQPIEIHLPNAFEPYFEIKDFGTGLDVDDIFGLYTTYFESTKTESNDFIGQMGLGSKSPFAYCNQFSVSSRYNGNEYHFTAFINENGIPSIALLNTTKTNEHNGLTLRLPIKQCDFNEVRENAQRVFERFDPKPVVRGGEIVWKQPETPIMSGKGWRIYPNTYTRNRIRAIMGLIEYQVTGYHYVGDVEYTMLNTNMEVDFAVGDLSVTASREGISFDKPTVANFHKRLCEIQKEVFAQIEDMINSQPNLWHAQAKLFEIVSINPFFNELVGFHHPFGRGDATIRKIPLWRGEVIPKEFNYDISCKVKVDYFSARSHRSSSFRKEKLTDKISTVAKNTIDIYYNELGDVRKAQVRKRINQQNVERQIYVIHKEPNVSIDQFKKELTIISQKMGGYKLKNLLNIEVVKDIGKTQKQVLSGNKQIRVLCGEKRLKSHVFINRFEKLNSDCFLKEDVIPWYLPVDGHKIVVGKKSDGSAVLIPNIWGALQSLRSLGLKIPFEIVAIPYTKIKKVPNNWINALTKIREYVLDPAHQHEISMIHEAQKIVKSYRDFFGYHEEKAKNIKCLELEEATKIYNEALKVKKTHEGRIIDLLPLLNLLNSMGIVTKVSDGDRLISLLEQFQKKYPLLAIMRPYERWINPDAVNQYIEAIDLFERMAKTRVETK